MQGRVTGGGRGKIGISLNIDDLSTRTCVDHGHAWVSDIIARVSFLILSHYLTYIVYRDMKATSRYLYDI